MYCRNKNRPKKIPLVVKEVILPKKETSGISQTHFKKEFGILKADVDDFGGNPASVKIGCHEIKPVNDLVTLEKKPLENYFEGTKEKKQHKKKAKPQKINKSLNEFNLLASQTGCNDEICRREEKASTSRKTSDKVIKECLIREEKIVRKKFQYRLQKHEKVREYKEREHYGRQRLKEKKYIQQQENLVDTWLTFLKRRNELKKLSVDCNCSRHSCWGSRHSSNKITVSIVSREFWNDEDKEKHPSGKAEGEEKPNEDKNKPTYKHSILDSLGEGFLEKLVFVDDEDSDECDNSPKNS